MNLLARSDTHCSVHVSTMASSIIHTLDAARPYFSGCVLPYSCVMFMYVEFQHSLLKDTHDSGTTAENSCTRCMDPYGCAWYIQSLETHQISADKPCPAPKRPGTVQWSTGVLLIQTDRFGFSLTNQLWYQYILAGSLRAVFLCDVVLLIALD